MAEKRALTLRSLPRPTLSTAVRMLNPEGVVMRVEQHLMGLQQIGADGERPAVAKLGVRHLQLDTNATDDREVLAPVELESLTWCKRQRHEASPPGSLLQPMTFLRPGQTPPHDCRIRRSRG